jgi:ParB-like chromosome segregation protein Spo0J
MAALQIEDIDVDLIAVPANRRPINQDAVDRLAESIDRIGLRTPLTVVSLDDGKRLDLVAGNHRLAAVRKLGWSKVACFVIEDDAIDAAMWEIAENLHRAELSALERSEQIARWIELADTRKLAQVAQVSELEKFSTGGRGITGGISAASREIGIDRDDARRAVKVASLSDEAKSFARETGLENNRSALLQASREADPSQQIASLQRRFAAKVADDPLNDLESKEMQVRALMAAWNRAGKDAREEFLLRIDAPVMSAAGWS